MRRREFIAGFGGAVVLSSGTRAQQTDRVRRIGVLMGWGDQPEYRSMLAAFVQELAHFGWMDGGNVRIEVRWTNGEIDQAGPNAKQLLDMKPDVILASTTPVTVALQREARSIPIVFVGVADAVGAGVVASLARPGGNITGFVDVEAGMVGKWLNLLKEIAPRLTRVAIMFNPETAPGGGNYYLGPFEAAARSLNVEPVAIRVRSVTEIESAVASLGSEQAGLVVMNDSFVGLHKLAVISSAARNRIPTVFPGGIAKEGGLISYGPDLDDIFRRAAVHVDRILRGAQPSDLPVELPIKFNLIINLKTANALGLTVPTNLLAIADQVIE